MLIVQLSNAMRRVCSVKCSNPILVLCAILRTRSQRFLLTWCKEFIKIKDLITLREIFQRLIIESALKSKESFNVVSMLNIYLC